ncbi:MAG: hypothetical protein WBA25_14885 [Jannaschia sp.]
MSAASPHWHEIIRTFSLAGIAGVGVLIAYLQYRLANLKREDELFDRRYSLLSDIVKQVQAVCKSESRSEFDFEEFSARAEILFDYKFSANLRSSLLKAAVLDLKATLSDFSQAPKEEEINSSVRDIVYEIRDLFRERLTSRGLFR